MTLSFLAAHDVASSDRRPLSRRTRFSRSIAAPLLMKVGSLSAHHPTTGALKLRVMGPCGGRDKAADLR